MPTASKRKASPPLESTTTSPSIGFPNDYTLKDYISNLNDVGIQALIASMIPIVSRRGLNFIAMHMILDHTNQTCFPGIDFAALEQQRDTIRRRLETQQTLKYIKIREIKSEKKRKKALAAAAQEMENEVLGWMDRTVKRRKYATEAMQVHLWRCGYQPKKSKRSSKAPKKRTKHASEKEETKMESPDEAKPDAEFERNVEELKIFRKEQGHSNVPYEYADNLTLGHWVNRQRALYHSKTLNDERKDILNQLELEWDGHEIHLEHLTNAERWEYHFQRLSKLMSGTRGIRLKDIQDRKLLIWVECQRRDMKKNTMSRERMHRLSMINFDWGKTNEALAGMSLQEVWDMRFHQLVEYKNKHGHFDMPDSFGTPLYSWMVTQRKKNNRGELEDEKFRRLNDIGFPWNKRWKDVELAGLGQEEIWERRYRRLCDFHREYGHCNVPKSVHKNNGDKDLCGWVYRQRELRRKKKISEERISRLDQLNFDWKIEHLDEEYL